MYYFNTQVKDTVQPIDVNERNFPHIWNSKDFSKAIYIEKKDGNIYVETLSDDLEYIKTAIESFKGNVTDTICEIKWTVDDLRIAYERKYGRNATDKEIEEILDRLNVKRLQEVGIEYGWEIINEVI
jgi:hypothetical protein